MHCSLHNRESRILRWSAAGCFIGHGAFGLLTKVEWLPYFATFGIGPHAGLQLMPFIGCLDLLVATFLLLRPSPAVYAWAVLWTLFTASLRPLAGQGWSEFFERAGNYGPPLTLLFAALESSRSTPRFALDSIMRVATALLLAGHAGCLLILHKVVLAQHMAMVWPNMPVSAEAWVGVAEFALAGMVLLRPSAELLIGVCLWKLATESLYPISGAPIWEFVERSGSYGLPLAFALLLHRQDNLPTASPSTSLSS
jgi:hypothetical protein